jgi:hypothetical protein
MRFILRTLKKNRSKKLYCYRVWWDGVSRYTQAAWSIKILKTGGYSMYRQFWRSETVRSAHSVLYVLYVSQYKQWILFPI